MAFYYILEFMLFVARIVHPANKWVPGIRAQMADIMAIWGVMMVMKWR